MGAEVPRSRPLGGVARWIQKFLLISLMLLGVLYVSGLHLYLRISIMPAQYYGLFLALTLSAVFLTVPISTKAPQLRWYDIILSVLGFAVGLYVTITWRKFNFDPGLAFNPEGWIPGIITIILCIEAVRRVIGPIVATLALVLILYLSFGYLLPGILWVTPISLTTSAGYLYLDVNAMFGIPIAVVSTMVLGFILFGAVLLATGGGRALNNFALATFGRFSGGPAKVAVVSSSLFGTLSGSVSANVVLTGSMTIPMMKSTGYKPHTAAAIEAVASTGGQLMPPVMGAAAFVIAEFLGVPYRDVVIAAFLPAVLFYVTVFLQVHLEAKKLGLSGLSKDKVPRLGPALRATWVLVVPLAVLIYTLFILHWNAGKAALLATLIALIVGYFRKESRLGLSGFLDTLVSAGRIMINIGAMVAVAGIIVGAIHLAGTAFSLTLFVTGAAAGLLPVLLLIIGLISMLLGMGMTTTVVYVIVAVLVCPAVIALGIPPLAAHLFVFYYALLSFITPPVCPAAYIAAPIAGAPMMKTGWTASRLGIIGYIVPFIFVFSPALLMQGSPGMIVFTLIMALAGTVLVAIGVNGYLFKPIGWLRRILLILAGLGLLMPISLAGLAVACYVAGAILAILVLSPEWRTMAKKLAT